MFCQFLQLFLLNVLHVFIRCEIFVYAVDDGHTAVNNAYQKQSAHYERKIEKDGRCVGLRWTAHSVENVDGHNCSADGHVGDLPVVVVVLFVGLLHQNEHSRCDEHNHWHGSLEFDRQKENETAAN